MRIQYLCVRIYKKICKYCGKDYNLGGINTDAFDKNDNYFHEEIFMFISNINNIFLVLSSIDEILDNVIPDEEYFFKTNRTTALIMTEKQIKILTNATLYPQNDKR